MEEKRMKKSKFFLLGLVVIFACLEVKTLEEIETEKKAAIEKNLYTGRVITAIYLKDSTIMVKNDPAGGAVAGGVTAALLGFGPVGIIVGAALGAEAEAGTSKPFHSEKLFLVTVSQGDTSFFEILLFPLHINLLNKYSYPTRPSLLQIYLSARPGTKIRIPSSNRLSTYAKVYSNFIFFRDEKIPGLD